MRSTVFEKQVADYFATQQRDFFYGALGDTGKGFGGIEDLRQHAAVESVDSQKMLKSALSVELDIGPLHFSPHVHPFLSAR